MTDSVIYTSELGRVFEEQGYFKKAGNHFSGALKNDPENPILIEALGRINAKKNDSIDFSSDLSSDLSSLSGILEQWVHLVLLRQRAARLAHKSER